MAGNLEFIKSASGTSVSSLSVTDCFSADYDVYEVYITSLDQSATAGVYISLLDSVGSEITSASYDNAFLLMYSTTSFLEGRYTGQTSFLGFSYNTTSYEQSIGFKMVVFNPYNSSSYSFIKAHTSLYRAGLGTIGYKSIGVLKSAETCTGIKVFGDTGSYDDIQLSVYGVK